MPTISFIITTVPIIIPKNNPLLCGHNQNNSVLCFYYFSSQFMQALMSFTCAQNNTIKFYDISYLSLYTFPKLCSTLQFTNPTLLISGETKDIILFYHISFFLVTQQTSSKLTSNSHPIWTSLFQRQLRCSPTKPF